MNIIEKARVIFKFFINDFFLFSIAYGGKTAVLAEEIVMGLILTGISDTCGTRVSNQNTYLVRSIAVGCNYSQFDS